MKQKNIPARIKIFLLLLAASFSTAIVIGQQFSIAGKIVDGFNTLSFSIVFNTLFVWLALLLLTSVISNLRKLWDSREVNTAVSVKTVFKMIVVIVLSAALFYILVSLPAINLGVHGKVLWLDKLASQAETTLNATKVFDTYTFNAEGTPGGDVVTGSEQSVAARSGEIKVNSTVGQLRQEIQRNLEKQGYTWDAQYYNVSSHISNEFDRVTLRYDSNNYRIYVQLYLTKQYNCPNGDNCSSPDKIAASDVSGYDVLEVDRVYIKLGNADTIYPF